MAFAAPEWLALLPFLGLAAWRFPALRLRRPLRLLCLALLAVALAEPGLPQGGSGRDLWVLVDRSASVRDLLEPQLPELSGLLARGRRPDDRLRFVDFAEQAQVRDGPEAFRAGTAQTRTAAAALLALQRADPRRATRLLALTDGHATEPLSGLAERLQAQGVALDYRLFPPPSARDYAVASLALPARVQALEPFLIELSVAGEPDAELPYQVLRDGLPAGQGTASVRGGVGRVRLTDRLAQGGAYRYSVVLQAKGDPVPGNDRGDAWVEVAAGPRVLLVTGYEADPLEGVLRTQGFAVETVTRPETLQPGRLSGARALLLNDVPAARLPRPFLEAVDGWVRVQGGGLLMAGGRHSFGAGGYAGSPIDALLPVSTELRQEHRKLTVALAIALDRSGSMAATVAGGLTKMALADEGAARSIELLSSQDAVAVLAVDSEPHRIVPLGQLGAQRGQVVDLVRRIESEGGGIYIHEALRGAWEELKQAPLGQRHLILFADAADSEEPGDYPALLAEMVQGGCTVSVIGLGSEQDADAELLRDIARRGRGRAFFTDDAASLPAVFVQETVAVARSAFLEEPVGVRAGAGWGELSAKPVEGLDRVDGYNLSYLRERATGALWSEDEYRAPLLAFWQRGAGRAAAVSFPLGGPHSMRVRQWERYGDFAQTLARWLMGSDLPPGVGLDARLRGTRLGLDLLVDPGAEAALLQSSPRALVMEGTGEPREVVWERIAPGRFQASLPLLPGRMVRGAVQVGAATIPFGPLEAPGGAEWARDPARVMELQAVAARSGGVQRVDLARAWDGLQGRAPRDLRPPLLLALLLLFLAEALRTRLGWAPSLALPRPPRPATMARGVAPPVGSGPAAPPPPRDRPGPSDEERRKARFDRARRGG